MSQPATERGTEAQATVTTTDPLTVTVDGAVTPCPAEKHAEVEGLTVGARVVVRDRSPRRPVVTGSIQDEE